MYDIYYFSGTGNTKAVAELLKNKLECQMYSIEERSTVENNMVLMFPIHAFGTPEIVLTWLRTLPKADRKAAIVTTGADYISINKNAAKSAIKILSSKGYDVTYDRIVVMASNFAVGYPDAFNKQLYEVAKEKVEDIAYDLNHQIKRRYGNTYSFSFSQMLYYAESRFGTKSFGLSLRTKDTCTKCMICVKLCPRNNIVLKRDKIRFKSHCMMCMRCIYKCPVQAIHSIGMNFAILSGGYDIETLIKSPISHEYVTEETKGFYKHFINYIEDKTI